MCHDKCVSFWKTPHLTFKANFYHFFFFFIDQLFRIICRVVCIVLCFQTKLHKSTWMMRQRASAQVESAIVFWQWIEDWSSLNSTLRKGGGSVWHVLVSRMCFWPLSCKVWGHQLSQWFWSFIGLTPWLIDPYLSIKND